MVAEHTPPEGYAVCTWAKQDGERQFSILDPAKGTFAVAEAVVPGGRVRAVMVTEEVNRRMWTGCGVGVVRMWGRCGQDVG